MIRAIFHIMRVTIRQAWATRTIPWLLCAACLPAVLFPVLLKGDGSPQSALTVQLTYAPPTIFALLLITSIWMGAFSLAAERQQQQCAMLRTKPVSGFAIWLGKWAGVCLINTMALLLSGILFTVMLGIHNKDAADGTVWQAYLPDETQIIRQAQHTFDTLAAQKEDEDHAVPTMRQLVNRLRQQRYRVAPNATATWQIPLPVTRDLTASWRLRFRWRLDPMRRSPVSGTWIITSPGSNTPLATRSVSGRLDGTHEIEWENIALPASSTALELHFHAASENQPHIFFDNREPVRLQQAAGTRHMNLLRAAGVIVVYCAAITALALVLSACLSFPVAVFATYGVILALLIAAVAGQDSMQFMHSHSHDHDQLIAERLLTYTRNFLHLIHGATRNLRAALPFRAVAENLMVACKDHLGSYIFLALIFPILCGILAHIRMMREEIYT